MSNPRVTVIVPCFNESSEILEIALMSLQSQSYKNFECILIDESTDQKTINKCKNICNSDKRFTYIHPSERIGLAESLNTGIRIARGDLIARFDSDDICLENRLELQVNFMDRNLDIGVLGGALEIIDEQGSLLGYRVYPLEHKNIEKKFIYANAIAHPAVMLRKSILNNGKFLYDPIYKYSEDLELWLRLLNNGIKFSNLENILIKYRQQNTSRTKEHWRYNIMARYNNLSPKYYLLKITTILLLVFWSYLSTKIQSKIYKIVQLRGIS